jgi:glycerate 2-kinase
MSEIRKKIQKFRLDALKVIWKAIESVNPENAINTFCRLDGEKLEVCDRTFDISGYKNVYVIGAGKAATQMARMMENILGKRLTGGLVCTKTGHSIPLQNIGIIEAGHPLPDQDSMQAAQRTLQLAENCGKDDLIICLLSGGTSALWCAPFAPITFEDKRKTTDILLKSGAKIDEVNTFRKHISKIKGGRLAQTAHPATVITMAISDVIYDELSAIGSGPTVADPSTFKNAMDIADKYQLSPELPASVLQHIRGGLDGKIKETPKPGDPVFLNNTACVIASNRQALDNARQTGDYLGYDTSIVTSKLIGEASDVGRQLGVELKKATGLHRPGEPPVMILYGGETTVTVKGRGKGGRNQELALAAAMELEGVENAVLASVGTDGTDGPTDAAGAFADGTTLARGKEAGLDAKIFLDNNNSYNYFDPIGDLIRTGPTGTNVMDIQVLIIG